MSLWEDYKVNIYEKWRQKWFDERPNDIAEYSWNYLFTGGKQIRPKLFCELWHYLCPDVPINAELAFAIECIHVSSIVLDDTPWMDNADERRGKKTLHTQFTSKKAVLISYDLIDIAVDIWKNNKPKHVNQDTWMYLLKSKLQRLMIGQWYDLEKTGTLIELSSLKTGVLFELVSETVALCVGLDTDFWRVWGNNLGILFQWMDDYLDMEEDKQQNNRNAFNESYDTTLKNYYILWQSIEKGIGKKWFESDFGTFLKKYFTEKILDNSELTSYDNLSTITIEYPSIVLIPELTNDTILKKKYQFNFINAKDILKHMWNNIDYMLSTENSTKHNYWNIDESQWEFPVM
jgi:geranylgeranyl pyrophosphate synthase